jgi:hemerythrin superfamily protein
MPDCSNVGAANAMTLVTMQLQKSSSPRISKRPSASVDPASIFDVLIADHRAVAAVFDLLKDELEQKEPDQEVCRDLLMKIDALLTPHARAEEELIYPAFAAAAEAIELSVAEGYEEHALVHQLCAQMKELAEVDKIWCAKAKVLMDLVEHHVLEEEDEQFPEARKVVKGADAFALAAEFLAGKDRIAAELGLPDPETLDLPPPKRTKPAEA